jgi:hypothetical protein
MADSAKAYLRQQANSHSHPEFAMNKERLASVSAV